MRIPLRIQEKTAALLVAGLLASSISTASGQESTTRGFNLGVHLQDVHAEKAPAVAPGTDRHPGSLTSPLRLGRALGAGPRYSGYQYDRQTPKFSVQSAS